jgi:hypothetical protein
LSIRDSPAKDSAAQEKQSVKINAVVFFMRDDSNLVCISGQHFFSRAEEWPEL